jgi:hypothetical protein
MPTAYKNDKRSGEDREPSYEWVGEFQLDPNLSGDKTMLISDLENQGSKEHGL